MLLCDGGQVTGVISTTEHEKRHVVGASLPKARMLQTTLLMAWALMSPNVEGRNISCVCRGRAPRQMPGSEAEGSLFREPDPDPSLGLPR